MRLLNRLSSQSASDKNVEFKIRPNLNIDYPQSDIESISELPNKKGYQLITTFFGLYGVASPLPGYYTEELLDQEWDDKDAGRGFLDIIHQQLYPLLYQAWLKYRFSHNAIEDNAAAYWEIIFSLLGLPEEFRAPGDLSGTFLKYTGILNQRPKTQIGLKTILADYLKPVKVDIEPCVLRKITLSQEQRCMLNERNHKLGFNSLIGDQVSDRSGKYMVRIGPLTIDQFLDILTKKRTLKFISTVRKLFMVQPLQCDIVLELAKGEAKPVCLGQAEYGVLGQSTWLIDEDNEDTYSVTIN